MQENNNILTKISAWLLIIMMGFGVFSQAVYFHNHQSKGGIYSHAHPFQDNSDKEKPVSHSHSDNELLYISYLEAFTSGDIFRYIISIEEIEFFFRPLEQSSKCFTNESQILGRAPPANIDA